jgi:hypothetical protein
MSAQEQLQRYLRLAHQYEQLGQNRHRDRCLELALAIAWQAGKVSEAERLWQRLRHSNPHHYLCGFGSAQEALQRPEVKEYLANAQNQASEWLTQTSEPSASSSPPFHGTSHESELVLPLETSWMRDPVDGSATVSQTPVASERPSPISAQSNARSANPAPRATVPASGSRSGSSASLVSAPHSPSVGSQVPASHATPGPAPVHDSADAISATTYSDRVTPWVAGALAVLFALLVMLLAVYIVFSPFLPLRLGR